MNDIVRRGELCSPETGFFAGDSNLVVEVYTSGTSGVVRIKNNTRLTVSAVSANVKLYKYQISVASLAEGVKPNSWDVTFWQYCTADGSVKNESKDFTANVWHHYEYISTPISLTAKQGVTYTANTGECSVAGLTLLPNESVEILTFTASAGVEMLVQASASITTSSAANSLMLVKGGVAQKYIVNYSENCYFVRFDGTIPNGESFDDVVTVDGYNYYVYVVRPGQIIETSSTATAIKSVLVGETFDSAALVSAGWNSSIITHLQNYLN